MAGIRWICIHRSVGFGNCISYNGRYYICRRSGHYRGRGCAAGNNLAAAAANVVAGKVGRVGHAHYNGFKRANATRWHGRR